MKRSEKFIVGVIIVAFIVFLALFSIYESNLTGEGQQDQNISGTTGDFFFIENIALHHQETVDMANVVLIKQNILKLDN